MKTVYIIEDEESLRSLLSTFFASTFPKLEVLGVSGNGLEGFEDCMELVPDLVIVDVQLPEMGGLVILQELKRQFPLIKILLFTGNISALTLKIAIHNKADGIINKISGLEELTKAIYAVQNNEQFFSPEIYDEAIQLRKETGEH
jgi:DNA-binding NarL/FixJ family response regulator